MTRAIAGPTLREQPNQFTEPTELRDESGRVLGYYHPLVTPGNLAGMGAQSPFSREEIESRRQQQTGRPLKEILERLGQS